jgi:hypothetical protein
MGRQGRMGCQGHLGRQGRLGRQGHQKLTKEYLAGPTVSMPWRVTGIIKNEEDLILSIVFDIFLLKTRFFAFCTFFLFQEIMFLGIFSSF